MQGILIVDKPAGWTSFDVIAKMRGVLGTRKLGHSGTLDPMATGVLPVFCGGASKAVDLQLDHDKTYRATLRLGARTDTGDITGAVLETRPVTAGEAELTAALPRFVGPQMQLPPMYSAVKVNGQPLYKAARQGLTVERKARPIEIYAIEYEGSPAPGEYTLTVRCSKGTYIRTLLEDIAAGIGQLGAMSALRRTRAGLFTEADAHTLEEILAGRCPCWKWTGGRPPISTTAAPPAIIPPPTGATASGTGPGSSWGWPTSGAGCCGWKNCLSNAADRPDKETERLCRFILVCRPCSSGANRAARWRWAISTASTSGTGR